MMNRKCIIFNKLNFKMIKNHIFHAIGNRFGSIMSALTA